jgi:superfamily I DNA/RNA helicase
MPSNNSVVIASAGSGKTWDICNKAINNPPPFKKALLVTYTNRGKESIINEYKKQNLGVVDDWIVVKTWYQFILSEFIKPYQVDFFKKINLIKSIDFSRAYGYTNMISSTKPERYLNNNYDVLSNEVSRLAVLMIEKSSNKVLQRLEETYCTIYFDEVQDFIGDDISILELLFDSSISIHCVGDPKQSTYKTHNTKKYSKKSGVNTYDYFSSLEEKVLLLY